MLEGGVGPEALGEFELQKKEQRSTILPHLTVECCAGSVSVSYCDCEKDQPKTQGNNAAPTFS